MLAHVERLAVRLKAGPRRLLLLLPVAAAVAFGVWFAAVPRQAVDLTAALPAETLLYLETRDLGKALGALAGTRVFEEAASSRPDLSALEGMQVAVAVVGFEADEQPLNAEASEANLRPRFVAVAETGLWGWQARSFAEKSLGGFVVRSYGGQAELEAVERDSGVRMVWKSADGRRAFAFVRKGRIFFGNDEAAIDRCLAAEKGEAQSLFGNETLRSLRGGSPDALGIGYLSGDGIAKFSNVLGLTAALSMTENEVARSFIARTVPQMVRGTVKEVTWSVSAGDGGLTDTFEIALAPQTARALAASARLEQDEDADLERFVSSNVFSVTRYDMSEPDVAWTTAVESASSAVDQLSGRLVAEFSDGLLDPFGITSPKDFLRAVRGRVFTAHFDSEGEESFAVARFAEVDEVKRALGRIDFGREPEAVAGAQMWRSADGDLAAAFSGNIVIVGNSESVSRTLRDGAEGAALPRRDAEGGFRSARAAAVTLGREIDTAERVIALFSEKKDPQMKVATRFQTETVLSDRGITRRTVSPFGFLGIIVSQVPVD